MLVVVVVIAIIIYSLIHLLIHLHHVRQKPHGGQRHLIKNFLQFSIIIQSFTRILFSRQGHCWQLEARFLCIWFQSISLHRPYPVSPARLFNPMEFLSIILFYPHEHCILRENTIYPDNVYTAPGAFLYNFRKWYKSKYDPQNSNKNNEHCHIETFIYGCHTWCPNHSEMSKPSVIYNRFLRSIIKMDTSQLTDLVDWRNSITKSILANERNYNN